MGSRIRLSHCTVTVAFPYLTFLHIQEEPGSVTSTVECLQSLQPLEYSVKSNYVGNNDEVVDIAESWRRCLLELQTKVHTKVRNHRENY